MLWSDVLASDHTDPAHNFMPVYPGGEEWYSYLDPGRPAAEAVFARLFGETATGLGPGYTHLAGQARTSLVYTFALVVQNVRSLRAWWQDTATRSLLPPDLRRALEQDPLLWPNDRLAAELPELFP